MSLKVKELNEKPGARKNPEMRDFVKQRMRMVKLKTTKAVLNGIIAHYFPFRHAVSVLELYKDLVEGNVLVDFKDANGMPLYIHDQQEKQDE